MEKHELFNKVPHMLWRHGITICGSNYARDLLISLMDFEGYQGDEVYPTDETLALINGVSTKTIQRARRELKRRGLIEMRIIRINGKMKYHYTVQHDKITEWCKKMAGTVDCESMDSESSKEYTKSLAKEEKKTLTVEHVYSLLSAEQRQTANNIEHIWRRGDGHDAERLIANLKCMGIEVGGL